MTHVSIACVVGDVSHNVSYIVPGSSELRELWMVRLREVIFLLLAMLSVLMRYNCGQSYKWRSQILVPC